MFPFGAVIVRVMSPVLSVVPLMSIVVEPSTPPAVSDNPLLEASVTIDDVVVLLTERYSYSRCNSARWSCGGHRSAATKVLSWYTMAPGV